MRRLRGYYKLSEEEQNELYKKEHGTEWEIVKFFEDKKQGNWVWDGDYFKHTIPLKYFELDESHTPGILYCSVMIGLQGTIVNRKSLTWITWCDKNQQMTFWYKSA